MKLYSTTLSGASMDLNTSNDNQTNALMLITNPKALLKNTLKNLGNSFKNALKSTLQSSIASALAPGNYGTQTEPPDPRNVLYVFNQDLKSLYTSDNIYSLKNESVLPPIFHNELLIKDQTITNTPQRYENPNQPSSELMRIVNTYQYTVGDILSYDGEYTEIDDSGKQTGKKKYATTRIKTAPSLFNPHFGINIFGIAQNNPLLDNQKLQYKNLKIDADWDDCSIKRLVNMSQNGELGHATYKYADFMYCKNLGIPNNRLITLRKFVHPVGDNIFKGTNKTDSTESNSSCLACMVTYFDTEENNLENIMTYNYNASWRKMESNIQEIRSEEGQGHQDGKMLPLLINTFNSSMNNAIAAGISGGGNGGTGNAYSWLWGKMGLTQDAPYTNNPAVLGSMSADKNKIYEPKNTLRSNHYYEGNLTFNHEFELTFKYSMRSYDNINQKAAFLDLITNVLSMTYKNGNFWGGSRPFLGPKPNNAGWTKANKVIDEAFKGLGGVFDAIFSDSDNGDMLNGVINALGTSFSNIMNQFPGIKESASELINNVKNGNFDKVGQQAKELAGNVAEDALGALKGKIKNQLGRPQVYAMDSLINGGDTGLWHVTIGNPRSPIAAFGNLIVTKSSITHSGPLGIDDFPTELTVKITLQHARPRDAAAIQRMYTGGTGIGVSYKEHSGHISRKTAENKKASKMNPNHNKKNSSYFGIPKIEEGAIVKSDALKWARNCEEIF